MKSEASANDMAINDVETIFTYASPYIFLRVKPEVGLLLFPKSGPV